MPYCKICGHKSKGRVCDDCQYFLDRGVDEETIRKMLSNDKVKKIWKENEKYAEELAHAYYDSVIENYPDDSSKNFGFNAFVDGIRVGLDIIMPLISEEDQRKAVEKINSMLKRSEERNDSKKHI